MAKEKAINALEDAKQKLQDGGAAATASAAKSAAQNISRPTPPPPPSAPRYEDEQEDVYDGYTSYDEYMNNDCSDEDLEELGEMVDEAIYNDELDDEDVMDDLYEEAEEAGLSREEFEEILDARIAELRDALDHGVEREVVYRTRSVWRRCPACHHLVASDQMFCYCGYQVRHRVVTAVAASFLKQGKLPTNKELANLGYESVRDKLSSRLGMSQHQADQAMRTVGTKGMAMAEKFASRNPQAAEGLSRLKSKSSSMFGSSSSPSSSSSRSSSRSSSLSSSSRTKSSSSKSSSSKSSGLFGGSSSKKSSSKKKSGFGLGLGKKRR